MPFSKALRSSGSAVLLVAGVAAVFAQATPDAWPQFRRSPALNGVASAPLQEPLRRVWTYEAGSPVESSPAIAGGIVYIGSSSGDLHAIDLTTGAVKWKYLTNKDLGIGESSPAVANGIVYVGDLAGVLHAVDAATGKPRWTFKTGAEIKSSPVVAGTRVLIGSYDGKLYGLDAATGKSAWQYATENYVHATPAISNGVAYFGGCDEYFHGVRVSDGQQVVKLSTDGYTAASAALDAGVAYYGTFANDVIAVDIAARKVKWRFEDPDRQFPFYSSAAIANGVMVLGGRDKQVRALDLATGKPR
jgi:outer membrane protein assembly factor BamB